MRRFLLLAIFLCTHISVLCQDIFDLDIHVIEIFFSNSNWDDSLTAYLVHGAGDRLVADSIVIDGKADQDVGVKYTEHTNPSYIKKSLNLKLDYVNNGQSIDGYNELNLSNGVWDPSFTREVLAYEIARTYMPASKATYANVYVNGNLLGLYTLVQSIDDDFTNENFYERKGPLFKAETDAAWPVPGCSFTGLWGYYADTNCYQYEYQMLSSNDWQKLSNFKDTVNNNFTEIENVLDIDRALWMMAFSNLIVSLSGPINGAIDNYYLFKDNNQRFNPIISGNDEVFGSASVAYQQAILHQFDPFFTSSTNAMTFNIFSNDTYKRMYIAHMRTIIDEYFSNNYYKTRANQLQQLIDVSVMADPNYLYSYADFQNNLNTEVVNTNPFINNDTIIGLTDLIDNRISFLQNITDFTAVPPSITTTNSNQGVPNTSIDITATITNASYVYIGHRSRFADNFEKLEMFDDGLHNDGVAGDNIYGVSIPLSARELQYYIYAENNDAGVFSPQRAEKEFHEIAVVNKLVINEVLAANVNSNMDQSGEYDDWVELYNGNLFSINLNGYYLSDNENDLTKWSFPNVTIQPNDYLIIWCDTAGNTQPGLHTTYRLLAEQEEVYLTDPTGTVIDAVHFVNMPVDISYSRVPNGTGVFTHQNPTFKSSNGGISSASNSYNQKKIQVYPNPSTGVFIVKNADSFIKIFDILGREIFDEKVIESPHWIDLSSFEKGVYFVLSNNGFSKIIKQ